MGKSVAISDSQASVEGYLALPEGSGPGIIVVHDWFGPLPHIQRACDDLAGAGFVTLAVDLYQGRTTTNPSEAATLLDELDAERARNQIGAATRFLRAQPQLSPDRVGAIGYSIGGWLSLLVATTGILDAVVAYYAVLRPSESAPITCPVLGHFAEVDDWEPSDAPERFFADLQAQGTVVEQHIYPGTEHSFANADVTEFAPDAAGEAWERTVAFLRQHLAG